MSNSSSDTVPAQLPDSPYPGIDPYRYADRGVYSGREAEARDLLRLVVIYRGVLLYSSSGVGKSSLINAGLVPLALAEGFQPQRVRVQPRLGQEIVIERLSENKNGGVCLLPNIFVADDKERVTLSTEALLEGLREKASQVHPLLVFDQFEEWATLFEEGSAGQTLEQVRTAQDRICQAIAALLRETSLPVKVLISLREDYLAKLTPLFKMSPKLPDQYLRLEPLEGRQISHVIRQPFVNHPEHYSRQINAALADEIQRQFLGRASTRDVPLTEVQIVCRSLFESRVPTEDLAGYFQEHGGVQGLLEQYLEQALESLGAEQREPAICLLTRMVTSAGTRLVIWQGDLLKRVENDYSIPPDLAARTLDNLERNTKLVRRESRRDVYYYEIASEFLVGWIRKQAQEHERLAEQRKEEKRRLDAESQKKQAEAQRRAEEQARNRRHQIVVLCVIVALVAILAIVAFKKEVRNAKEAREADSLRLAQSANLITGDPESRFLLAMSASSEIFSKDKKLLPESEAALRQSLADPQFNCTLRGVIDSISDLAFSPDGTRLATAEYSKTVRVWDARYGTLLLTLSGHTDNVVKVVFDLTGKYLATASNDQTIRIWDASSGQSKFTIPVDYDVWGLSFSKDGSLAAIGDDTRARLVWDSAGHPARRLTDAEVSDRFGLVKATDWNIKDRNKNSLLHDRSGQIVYATIDPTITMRSFSPDGKYLATVKTDGSLEVRDANQQLLKTSTAQSTKQLSSTMTTQSSVKQISFAPNGKSLAMGEEDGTVEIIGRFSGFLKLNGHNRNVTALAFSPDGNRLATASDDRTIKVWAASPILSDSAYNRLLLFSGDSARIVGLDSKSIRVWDASSLRLVSQLRDTPRAIRLATSFDGNRLATVSEELISGKAQESTRGIRVLDTAAGQLLALIPIPGKDPQALSFNRDGTQLFAVSLDNTLTRWDASSGKMLDSRPGQSEPFEFIFFSSDGSHLAGVRKDGAVTVSSSSTGALLYTTAAGEALGVTPSFSPDGSILATAARDKGAVKLWDGSSGRLLHQLATDTSNTSKLIFSPDGARLAIVNRDDDGTIEVWDTSKGQLEHTFLVGTTRILSSVTAFSNDRQSLILVDHSGVWEPYPLDDKVLMAQARDEKRATRPLTSRECRKYRLNGTDCQLAELMDDGIQLAQAGNVSAAEARFARVRALDSTYPETDARRLAAEKILVDAKTSASSDDLNAAIAAFQTANMIDPNAKLNPQAEAHHWAAKGKILEAESLLAQGKDAVLWERAKDDYHAALELDPSVKVSGRDWNLMCWYGSLLGHAQEALEFCDRAVASRPEDPNLRDSRGLARALTGNLHGAIEDFQAFVDKYEVADPEDKKMKSQRQAWIKALSARQNPFTHPVLAGLMKE
jgi:WD40 repeat protein/tetratricopeptide (TPR) repeat protein